MAQALQIPSSPSGAAAAAPMLTAGFDTVGVGDVFNLGMTATGNGVNSTETLSPFTLTLADPLVLPGGVTLSNFHFVDTNNGTSGGFSNGVWTVTRGSGMPGSTSTLDLEANVTATSAVVPEPSSFAVLSVALAGLGLVWRRRGYAANT